MIAVEPTTSGRPIGLFALPVPPEARTQ